MDIAMHVPSVLSETNMENEWENNIINMHTLHAELECFWQNLLNMKYRIYVVLEKSL